MGDALHPNARRIGYARVSTNEQSLDIQIEALKKAGVHPDDIHVEKVSGVSHRRPKLKWMISCLEPGDECYVWKIDRLGRGTVDILTTIEAIRATGARFRSLTEAIDTEGVMGNALMLMAAVFAQIERDLIKQRTAAGVARAMERGVKFGQEQKLSGKQVGQAQRMRDSGRAVREIAEHFAVSHTTIYNHTRGPRRPRKT